MANCLPEISEIERGDNNPGNSTNTTAVSFLRNSPLGISAITCLCHVPCPPVEFRALTHRPRNPIQRSLKGHLYVGKMKRHVPGRMAVYDGK